MNIRNGFFVDFIFICLAVFYTLGSVFGLIVINWTILLSWVLIIIASSCFLFLALWNNREETARKVNQSALELQKTQARLESSMESWHMGFILTDNENKIISINASAKYLLLRQQKNPRHDVLLPLLTTQWTFEDAQEQLKESINLKENIQKCINEMKPIDINEVAFRDSYLHIFFSPILLFTKQHVGVIGTAIRIEDVTESKLLQRARDEFFSIASHELRTPLTAIRGNTSLIKQYYSEQLKDKKDLVEMISDIHESTVRLIEIVNDFLDISRLEQGKMEFRKEIFDLTELIKKVIEEMTASAGQKNIYLKLDPPSEPIPLVVGDKDRIRQVLYNLIGNAIKFTQQGGVTISLAKEGLMIKVRIIDTGVGIARPLQKLLFRKFQQAGESIFTRDSTRGTGLGLYISKLMVETMGGNIVLESSEEGKGSIFSFTILIASEKNLDSIGYMLHPKVVE